MMASRGDVEGRLESAAVSVSLLRRHLRCEMTGGKLMGGAVGGGDARGTERGGAGPLYLTEFVVDV
jgi:hypothetical protein